MIRSIVKSKDQLSSLTAEFNKQINKQPAVLYTAQCALSLYWALAPPTKNKMQGGRQKGVFWKVEKVDARLPQAAMIHHHRNLIISGAKSAWMD